MNRLDRLFAITTYLQRRSRIRAVELARVFEVSKRTIYRDIAALSEAGVPIISLPGQGYQIAAGFFLPPLSLSAPEATALVLGARQLAGQASGEVAAAADLAVAKITAVLPESARRRVDELSAVIRFFAPDRPRFDLDDPRLVELQRAIGERSAVAISYHGRNRDETTTRTVEPCELMFADGVWYVAGYCRLRQGERSFRLDRIATLETLAGTFPPRPAAAPPRRPVEVRVRFAEAAVRWVRERQHWSFVREERSPDGPVALYAPDNLDEITPWLLGWGTAAEVLAPPALRRRLRDEAAALAALLT